MRRNWLVRLLASPFVGLSKNKEPSVISVFNKGSSKTDLCGDDVYFYLAGPLSWNRDDFLDYLFLNTDCNYQCPKKFIIPKSLHSSRYAEIVESDKRQILSSNCLIYHFMSKKEPSFGTMFEIAYSTIKVRPVIGIESEGFHYEIGITKYCPLFYRIFTLEELEAGLCALPDNDMLVQFIESEGVLKRRSKLLESCKSALKELLSFSNEKRKFLVFLFNKDEELLFLKAFVLLVLREEFDATEIPVVVGVVRKKDSLTHPWLVYHCDVLLTEESLSAFLYSSEELEFHLKIAIEGLNFFKVEKLEGFGDSSGSVCFLFSSQDFPES